MDGAAVAQPPSPDATGEVSQALAQSGGATTTPAAASSVVPSSLPGLPDASSLDQAAVGQASSRPVGTLKQELLDRPIEAVVKEIGAIFSLSRLLGIENPQDTPEQKAKKAQLLQNFNQLTQEEQTLADQLYQERLARKQQQEQEDQIKKQQAAQEASSVAPPSSPRKGPPDPSGKSKSQAAMQQLKQDRTTIGKVQSAG